MELASRTAVITGASRGLGAGIARTFADRGLNLGLCARSESALSEGDQVVTQTLDVVNEAAVAQFADRVTDRFGRIDLWINNAGILDPIAPLRDITCEQYRHNLDINVVGVFNGTRAFVKHVRSREGGGVLINISSGAARSGYPGWSAYCASKAAVDLMTESVQLEEAESGLRAYALAPGIIDTDMQAQIRACTPEQFPLVDKFHELKAANAFYTPEWVAEQILKIAFSGDGPSDVRIDLRN